MDHYIHIKIWDADGNQVVNDFVPAQAATQEQIDRMVALINCGFTAASAAALVMYEDKKHECS